MDNQGLFWALAGTAVAVGALHSVAPDHWLPFTTVARARNWSAARTAQVTFLCGFAHVSVSVVLALLALGLGAEVLEAFGARLESIAGILLIGFGLVYCVWGLRRAVTERLHGHSHSHFDHVHDPSRASVLGLVLIFAADPCVRLIPIVIAAAPLGWPRVAGLIVLYEIATIGTMILIVAAARAGAFTALRAPWLDRYGDALAGGLIVVTGVTVAALGW
jgi:ABC-type nickel/cobalt efflux system permease component RcnA